MNPKMTREITAFSSPLPEAEVDFKAIETNKNLKCLLALKPELSYVTQCNCVAIVYVGVVGLVVSAVSTPIPPRHDNGFD